MIMENKKANESSGVLDQSMSHIAFRTGGWDVEGIQALRGFVPWHLEHFGRLAEQEETRKRVQPQGMRLLKTCPKKQKRRSQPTLGKSAKVHYISILQSLHRWCAFAQGAALKLKRLAISAAWNRHAFVPFGIAALGHDTETGTFQGEDGEVVSLSRRMIRQKLETSKNMGCKSNNRYILVKVKDRER